MNHYLTRRRLIGCGGARRIVRSAHRRALRTSLRCALRPGPRPVLPYTGPSLREVTAMFNNYYKSALAFEKKWNPPSRFKPLLTEEESRRRMEEDLKRAYGDGSPAARELEAAMMPPLKTAVPSPALTPIPPIPLPKIKCDVMAVPIRRLPNGFVGYDWVNARPA